MQRPITVLIVDDEEAPRAMVRRYLEEFPDFVIVDEVSSFHGMIEAVRRLNPDLLFLDDDLIDGYSTDALDILNGDRTGHIIFVSAYIHDQKKIVSHNPLGILLKPIARPKFVQLLQNIHDLFLLQAA
jgi:two-component system LytT family response regulator